MRAIEIALSWSLVLGATGCPADAYTLGAVDGGDTDAAVATDDGGTAAEPTATTDATGTTGTADGTNPVDPVPMVKAYSSNAFNGLGSGTWHANAGWLLVVDAAADAVYRVDPANVVDYLVPSSGAVGVGVDADGTPLIATSAPPQILAVPPGQDGTAIATGAPLVTPQTLVSTAAGDRYIADAGASAVLRLAADGALTVGQAGLDEPRGLAVHPDGTALYVGERAGSVLRMTIGADGSLGAPASVFDAASTLDGLCIDDDANLYVAGPSGLEVFAEDGEPWGTIPLPAPALDCTFGGADGGMLLVMTATTIYSLDARVAGPP